MAKIASSSRLLPTGSASYVESWLPTHVRSGQHTPGPDGLEARPEPGMASWRPRSNPGASTLELLAT